MKFLIFIKFVEFIIFIYKNKKSTKKLYFRNLFIRLKFIYFWNLERIFLTIEKHEIGHVFTLASLKFLGEMAILRYFTIIIIFWIFPKSSFQKYKKWSYFRNYGRIWLVNELVLSVCAPIKCTKMHYNLIILFEIIVLITGNYKIEKLTDMIRNPFFDLRKSEKVDICLKN